MGFPLSGCLAEAGISLGHEPGAATANNGNTLTWFREQMRYRWGESGRFTPNFGLTGYFYIGMELDFIVHACTVGLDKGASQENLSDFDYFCQITTNLCKNA
jgi:hypothetical protein